jgi:hypothetical protein
MAIIKTVSPAGSVLIWKKTPNKWLTLGFPVRFPFLSLYQYLQTNQKKEG